MKKKSIIICLFILLILSIIFINTYSFVKKTKEKFSARADVSDNRASTEEEIPIEEPATINDADKESRTEEAKTNNISSDAKSTTEVNNQQEEVTAPQNNTSTFTENTDKQIKYLLYTPKNAHENMPLIVYLHGGSMKGDDLNLVTKDSLPKYLKAHEIEVDAYVVMPQLSSNYKGWIQIKEVLYNLINKLQKDYSIDKNKISLTGHSMGGKGTYDLALAYSTLFSKIAPISGSIEVNDDNVNKLSNMQVYALVGSADTIVDPASSRKFIEKLSSVNENAKIKEFEGASHFDMPSLAYKNSDVLDFLIK